MSESNLFLTRLEVTGPNGEKRTFVLEYCRVTGDTQITTHDSAMEHDACGFEVERQLGHVVSFVKRYDVAVSDACQQVILAMHDHVADAMSGLRDEVNAKLAPAASHGIMVQVIERPAEAMTT
jgi:hypothetical protein